MRTVEVRTIAWQWQEGETQVGGFRLNDSCSVARCAIPDNDDWASDWTQPVGEKVQKRTGVVTVASLFVPDETLTLREVLGAIAVNAVLQGWAIAQAPSWFARLSPGVSQVHIAMEMGLVNVEQPHLLPTDLGKGFLKLLDKCRSFLWIGFGEHLLAFLPAQTVFFQELVHGPAADFTLQDLPDPTAQFLHGPVVTRQVMLDGFALFHGCDDLGDLFWAKKGGGPLCVGRTMPPVLLCCTYGPNP